MPNSAVTTEDKVLDGIWSSLAVGTATDSTGFSLRTQACDGSTATGRLNQTDLGKEHQKKLSECMSFKLSSAERGGVWLSLGKVIWTVCKNDR